jgi:uncharacterized membrane protein YpjA
MRGHRHLEFEQLLHDLAVLGLVAFGLWIVVCAMGWAAGFTTVAREPAIRFMAAVLVLLVPSVVYADLKGLRYRSMTPEERLGLAHER